MNSHVSTETLRISILRLYIQKVKNDDEVCFLNWISIKYSTLNSFFVGLRNILLSYSEKTPFWGLMECLRKKKNLLNRLICPVYVSEFQCELMNQGRNELCLFVSDPIFWPKILIPNSQNRGKV